MAEATGLEPDRLDAEPLATPLALERTVPTRRLADVAAEPFTPLPWVDAADPQGLPFRMVRQALASR